MPGLTDPRVDAYIASAPPFAQTVLWHVRELVHRTVPDCEETMKWRMPFFTVNGKILGNMAAFKQHCSVGIWNAEIAVEIHAMGGEGGDKAMGSFGRVTSRNDLPADNVLKKFYKKAADDIRAGRKRQARTPHVRGVVLPDCPAEFAAALKKNKAAELVWDKFAPSHKREYLEWILDARREETRERRISQAIEWIAAGKGRNWKYESK